MDRLPRGFREGLRAELPRWREDGIVSPDAAAALHVRYDLDRVEPGLPSLLVLYLLAALLVGAGTVALVAWHWEAMAAAAKLALLGAGVVGFHAAGFALWKVTGRAARLGHALTLVGTLVFGASIGLVAQIFHVSGTWWGGLALFAAGALAAGLAYRSLPHLVLAAVLGTWIAGTGLAEDHPALGLALAWPATALFFGLAWRERSRTLLLAAAVGLGCLVVAALDGVGADEASPLALALWAAALVAAPVAATRLAHRGDTAAYLAAMARVGGRLAFYAVAYALSFTWIAREARLDRLDRADTLGLAAAAAPSALLAVAALLAGLRRAEADPLARGEALLVLGTSFALGAGLALPGNSGEGAALIANLALAFLAAGRVTRGLTAMQRAPFWEGIALAALLLLTRFLSLDVELWVKGTAFIGAGVVVFAAGFAFERRRVRAGEVAHVA